MKLRLSKWVLIPIAVMAAGSTSLIAETMVLNVDDGNGKIFQITSPDDLHLDPASVVVAVDAFGDEDREVNGVLFQTDKTDDNQVGLVERDGVIVDLTSTHFIDGWAAAPNFTGGEGNSAENLAFIMEDIRWSAAPSPVTMDISGLDGGGLYELQILVNEGGDRDRHWDISVNDVLVVDDFTSEGTNEGDDFYTGENTFVYSGEFEANNAGELNVIMQQHIGGQDQLGSDNNPILQALILHEVNTSDDDPNVLTSNALKYGQVASTPATVKQIRIRNSGPTNDLVISEIAVSGADADHFTVLSEVPLTIPPDTDVEGDPEPSALIDLSFDAKGETGAFSATLEITSNDETEAVNTIALSASVINLLGPASHLTLDEAEGSTEVADISGNDNGGIILAPTGSATLGHDPAPGAGTALKVAGGGELVIEGGSFDLLESFTVSMWLQLDSFGGAPGTVFAKGNVDTPAFALLAIGGSLGWLPEAAGENPEFVVENVLTEGQAHHVVVVHDNTAGARQVAIYVDGDVDGATVVTDPMAVTDDRSLSFQFGSYNGGLFLNGVIDEVQIYTRAIAPEDVVALHNNPGLSLPIGDVVSIDSDGDGLDDSREGELGTNPLEVDTDGDTLDDFAEVETYGSDPLAVDTDGDGTDDATEVAEGMDPTDFSDGDLDRDGLTNGREAELGTDPNNRDTDGDVFGDGFEVSQGSDPLDPNSPGDSVVGPIEPKVIIGKLAEDTLGDLVIHGRFTHAVNIGETEEDVQVGDINFASDTPGPDNIEFEAQNHIEDWGAANDFGAGPDAEGLAKVASGIRWSARPESVTVTLKDVQRGAYRLQMIFGEKCCDRGFAVTVDGEVLDPEFSPNAQQEGDHSGLTAAYFIYEFNQVEDGDILIDLDGTDADFPDGNAILSGVSLQFVQPLDGDGGGVPIEGLVGLWQFDGSAGDGSGNGHDGTLENGAALSDDVPPNSAGQSLQVSGGEQHVLVPHSDSLNVTEEITIAAWVKPVGDQAWDGILAKNPSDGSNANHAGNYELRIENGSRGLHFLHQQGGDNDTAFYNSAAAVITGDEWSHIAVTGVKNGDLHYYINGELADTWADPLADTFGATNSNPLYIGSRADLFTAMDGFLDDVALFNRALEPAEIVSIMNGEFFVGDNGGGDGPGPGTLGDVMKADGGAFSFTITEGTFDVEYSTDLTTWTVIASDVSGTYEDTDAGRNATAEGYYRAVAK